MNILVTGCFGFIGFNFIKELSDRKTTNFNIVGIDALSNPYSKVNKEIFTKNNNFEFSKPQFITSIKRKNFQE